MGIYLGQLPPAEMARLKAEIAETMIAYFSYPRFYDYRTNTLRMRPVDRTKRQEVWTFLSSFDFNAFSRIDVTSPEFQRQMERLFIQFVQRNRAFFGQQGRKRMSDVRALITSSSAAVSEGLRSHLNGRAATPFGNARPVVSWSKTNGSGQLEPGWEQIASATMQLQQQLQEARGETRPGANGDARAAIAPPAVNGATNNNTTGALPRRSPRLRATTSGNTHTDTATPAARPGSAVPATRPIPQDEARSAPLSSGPLPMQGQPSGPLAQPQASVMPVVAANPSMSPAAPAAPPLTVQPPSPAEAPQKDLTKTEPLPHALTNSKGSAKVLTSEEDVAIFEEMRSQLIVWLRVEVVRAGVDLAGQTPAQLLEIVGQQDGVDETRLQIVSTLLGLANSVIAQGYATLVEYKQAMMFYLIHTRRTR